MSNVGLNTSRPPKGEFKMKRNVSSLAYFAFAMTLVLGLSNPSFAGNRNLLVLDVVADVSALDIVPSPTFPG